VLSLGTEGAGWLNTPLPLPEKQLILINGDSTIGYRLPL
jgi:uncharacterized protein (DUF2126 family)